MQIYEKALEGIRSRVSFGYNTIRVYQASELKSLQVGYSISPTGDSLTGDRDGDWLRKWVVIGYEEGLGDPIFIDTTEEAFPVYTAIHGEGRWDAKRIAVSLEAFGRALSAVADVAKNRESPVALENDPLTQSEKETTLAAIRRDNPGVKLEFWETLLS
jgi:hypothetical protein